MIKQKENDPQVRWIIDQHRAINHYYDDYLPYEFHLRMVRAEGDRFKSLVTCGQGVATPAGMRTLVQSDITYALWGHDLLEDTLLSYSALAERFSCVMAEIVYAVTNEKGRSRSERANDKYYDGIRATPGAAFVKLCDRIANVKYSKMTGSAMFSKYQKEQRSFALGLGFNSSHSLLAMFQYLDQLLTNQ